MILAGESVPETHRFGGPAQRLRRGCFVGFSLFGLGMTCACFLLRLLSGRGFGPGPQRSGGGCSIDAGVETRWASSRPLSSHYVFERFPCSFIQKEGLSPNLTGFGGGARSTHWLIRLELPAGPSRCGTSSRAFAGALSSKRAISPHPKKLRWGNLRCDAMRRSCWKLNSDQAELIEPPRNPVRFGDPPVSLDSAGELDPLTG